MNKRSKEQNRKRTVDTNKKETQRKENKGEGTQITRTIKHEDQPSQKKPKGNTKKKRKMKREHKRRTR